MNAARHPGSAPKAATTALSGEALELALLDTLFASAPLGIGLWDRRGRYVRVNDRLAAMHGVPAAAHVGRTIGEIAGDLGVSVEAAIRDVIATGVPVCNRQITGELPTRPGEERHWRASWVPVRRGSEIVGAAALVEELTDQVLAERERDALLATERGLRRRAEFLAQAAELLDASLDYEGMLARVAHIAVPDLAEWCAVDLLDDGGRIRRLAVAHADPAKERLAWELSERYPVRADEPVGVANVLRTGRTEVFWDIPDEVLALGAQDDEHLRLSRELGITGAVLAPLAVRDRVFGVISFVWSGERRTVSADDVPMIEDLARRAGMAIESARLRSEQERIASVLQRSLLPQKLPTPWWLEVGASYRAAGRSNEAGGDFYDLIALDDSRSAAVVGDVLGKGPEAAAVTALCRHTLRAGALEGHDPLGMLELLNRALRAYGERNEVLVFATVALALLERRADGTVTARVYAGGHPPPLVRRPGGTTPIEARGTLVGVFDDPRFAVVETPVSECDTLLLYTDGAIESRVVSTSLGEEGLVALLDELPDLRPRELVAAVEAAVLAREGGEPRDDIAMVALRPRPPR
jgi:PAS domain S-box-containing protein